MIRSLVIDTITADFTKFLERSKGSPYDIEKLGQVQSNLDYNGAAVYINIIGAGARDDPAFFRLYIGQASNLQRRVGQHHDSTYRKNDPSLRYHMIDCYNRPLKTVCFARIPIHLRLSDNILELVQNILEKLGTLLFQTLPAKILHQFEIEPKFPNIHCNVLSPLLQSQGDRLEAKYIEEAITFLQETDNPEILQYYQEHARQDPMKTLIMERALEKRGGVAHTFETLPESIKNYLPRRGFTNKNEVEAMIAPGATLVLSILMIMSSLGNATKHALGDDEYVKQYRLQETYENYDSSSVLAPLMRGPLGTDWKIVDLYALNAAQFVKRSSILSMSAQRVVSS